MTFSFSSHCRCAPRRFEFDRAFRCVREQTLLSMLGHSISSRRHSRENWYSMTIRSLSGPLEAFSMRLLPCFILDFLCGGLVFHRLLQYALGGKGRRSWSSQLHLIAGNPDFI